MTTLINLKHTKEYDVLIDRRSKWGNPFVIGKDGTREEVIEKYRKWFFEDEQQELRDSILELDGKTIACWCSPKACHGDVLIDYLKFYKIAMDILVRYDELFKRLAGIDD